MPAASPAALRHQARRLAAWRPLHFALLACAATLLASLMRAGGWQWAQSLDRLAVDHAFRSRGPISPALVAQTLPQTRDIIVVELPHPIPRPLLARVLGHLRLARVVAVDLMLVDAARSLDADEKSWYRAELRQWARESNALALLARRQPNIVLGAWPDAAAPVALPVASGALSPVSRWMSPPAGIWRATRHRAHLTVRADERDGVVRSVRLWEVVAPHQPPVPCLGLAVAALARGVSPQSLSRNRLDADGLMLINFVGGRECFAFDTNRVSYKRLLDGWSEPEDFRGKIVFVGETSTASRDVAVTPFGEMPGVQVHANIAATLLSGHPPTFLSPTLTVLLALLCCAFLVLTLGRWPLWTGWIVAPLLGAVLFGLSGASFGLWHRIVPLSVPIGALVLMTVGVSLLEYDQARQTLGRFIGREMLARVLRPWQRLGLGGQVEEATAFFCDLRGYSAKAARMAPLDSAALVNAYTSAVVGVVVRFGGRPIDFLGDGVFVLFEARGGPDFALRAALAALEVQDELSRLRSEWRARGLLELADLEAGIGLATGPMVIGLVGSENFLKLGAVGDPVNVAARLQSLSTCNFRVLMTGATHERVRHALPTTFCQTHLVKGHDEPMEVWGIGRAVEGEVEA